MIKISYAFLVHDESEELLKNVSFIKEFLNKNDEVVIVADRPTKSVLMSISLLECQQVKIFERTLQNNFADQKNFLNSKCSGDYIFNIDADEIPSPNLINNLHEIIECNNADVMLVPRINIVYGITNEHLTKWNWKLTPFKLNKFITAALMKNSDPYYKLLSQYELIKNIDYIGEDEYIITYYDPIVQFPDFQMRIYKNSSTIKWVNPVHEILTGYKSITKLPVDIETDMFLYHIKNITKQEHQNKFYETII